MSKNSLCRPPIPVVVVFSPKSHLNYKAREEFITLFPVALSNQQKSWNIRRSLLSPTLFQVDS